MKVIVGLGNPGRQYAGTRHNVGFEVVAALAADISAGAWRLSHEAEVADGRLGSDRVLLVLPQTFMNVSGQAVQPLLKFFKVEPGDVLVVCDDLNLPAGRLRIRAAGSDGGQKGLRDILQRLGTDKIARLRIGIGRPPGRMDAADYVLGRWTAEERPFVDEAVERGRQAVRCWIEAGTEITATRFNPDATAVKPADAKPDQRGSTPRSAE